MSTSTAVVHPPTGLRRLRPFTIGPRPPSTFHPTWRCQNYSLALACYQHTILHFMLMQPAGSIDDAIRASRPVKYIFADSQIMDVDRAQRFAQRLSEHQQNSPVILLSRLPASAGDCSTRAIIAEVQQETSYLGLLHEALVDLADGGEPVEGIPLTANDFIFHYPKMLLQRAAAVNGKSTSSPRSSTDDAASERDDASIVDTMAEVLADDPAAALERSVDGAPEDTNIGGQNAEANHIGSTVEIKTEPSTESTITVRPADDVRSEPNSTQEEGAANHAGSWKPSAAAKSNSRPKRDTHASRKGSVKSERAQAGEGGSWWPPSFNTLATAGVIVAGLVGVGLFARRYWRS